MHDSVMNFARKVLTSERIKGKRVLEVGSFNVNGSVRDFVVGLGPAEYVGVDISEQEDYVDIVMDAGELVSRFGPDSWDVVISTEMLEHAAERDAAVNNMKAVLRPGGLALVTARGPGFPLHNYPADHWRYTTDDVASMFLGFTTIYLSDDSPTHPGFLYAGFKNPVSLPPPAPQSMTVEYHSREAFDERMRVRRLPDSKPPEPFKAFYHIACMGNWKEVVEEQCAQFAKVGIRPTSFVLGTPADVEWLSTFDIDIAGSDTALLRYETPTLVLVEGWCRKNPTGAVMYVHSKGVSQPNCENKKAWRRLMMHYVVIQKDNNLELLKIADIVGVDWQHSKSHPHFSGNFWMARADWINSLDGVEGFRARGGPVIAGNPWQRMHAELWLGSKQWHHVESLCCTNTELWRGPNVFKLLAECEK